ncbi:hypothetical protein N0V88_006925 [Collariella sp. IMI 366227]|nr:hypothetical protein N0V88_006925 [Collariella sp. IMI 366227]
MSLSAQTNGASANGNGVSKNGDAIIDVGLVPNPNPTISGKWTVEKLLDTIPTGKPAEGTSSPVGYFHLLERLKTTKREGWRRFGIDRYAILSPSPLSPSPANPVLHSGESISDHMYRMSMMSMLAPPSLASRIDLGRCMKMCLIHDMAESIVGDITPVDGVAKPEKSRREAETMDYLTKNLLGNVHGGKTGEEIRAVWQEYEDSKTLESLFVHDIDKMELLLQMMEYEKRGKGRLDLGEFAYVKTKIVLEEVKAWAEELMAEREEFWAGQAHVHGEAGVEGGVAPEKREMQDAYYSKDSQV